MKTSFPCKITWSEDDKCWYVEAPGFYKGIMTYGSTLEEAKAMAEEALTGLLATHLEYGDDFSIPVKGEADWHEIELDPGTAFAMWLRGQRQARGMTQSDAADKMGVKYQVYQKLENPRTANPTLRTLHKIEQVFDAEVVTI